MGGWKLLVFAAGGNCVEREGEEGKSERVIVVVFRKRKPRTGMEDVSEMGVPESADSGRDNRFAAPLGKSCSGAPRCSDNRYHPNRNCGAPPPLLM